MVVVILVVVEFLKVRDTHKKHEDTPDNAKLQEVLYADDTILIATKVASMHKYLGLVEQESGKMELKLNKNRCKTICRTNRSYVKFSTGETVKKAETAEYLGVLLNTKADIEGELDNRIREAAITWRKLKPYWRKSISTKARKILTYNALIIRSIKQRRSRRTRTERTRTRRTTRNSRRYCTYADDTILIEQQK